MYHYKRIKSKQRPHTAVLSNNLFVGFPQINRNKKSSSMRIDFERNRLVKLPSIYHYSDKDIVPRPSHLVHSIYGSDK
jgi:hypothetical protein